MTIREEMVPMRDGVRLYAYCALPDQPGPVLFSRSPYDAKDYDPRAHEADYEPFVAAGYAVVHQSCRGTARSEGVFVPFEKEREDGLDTLAWIRRQSFYNGDIFLRGGSYCSYVHLSYLGACPPDVRGAMLWVMPTDMYRGMLVNDVFKQDVIIPWYSAQYHKNQADPMALRRDYPAVTLKRPLCAALDPYYPGGCPEFAALMRSAQADEAWTRPGGAGDALNALRGLRVPILLMEGWYDIYIGQAREMWRELPEATRARSALIIGPWPHSCCVNPDWDVELPGGDAPDDLMLDWFNHLRTGAPLNFAEEGRVKYYTIGEGRWHSSADLPEAVRPQSWYLNAGGALSREAGADGWRSWRYDPENPTRYEGGANAFCTVPSGVRADREPDFGGDVVSFVSAPLEEDLTFTGGVGVELTVRSDCEDTAFFVRIDVLRRGKYLPVQESVTTLRRQNPGYVPGETARVSMTTDAASWRVLKGERLRVDVASANWPTYPAHGNTAAPIAEQTRTRPAVNGVALGQSRVILPVVT